MTGRAKKKKVDFSVRPRANKDDLPPSAEQWVRGEHESERAPEAEAGPQKRLTLNLPTELHTSFKSRCVLEGVTIQDKVRLLIERDLAAAPAAPPV